MVLGNCERILEPRAGWLGQLVSGDSSSTHISRRALRFAFKSTAFGVGWLVSCRDSSGIVLCLMAFAVKLEMLFSHWFYKVFL
jgi:hypothetical protein